MPAATSVLNDDIRRAIAKFGRAVGIRVKNTVPEARELPSKRHKRFREAANRIHLAQQKLTVANPDFVQIGKLLDRACELIEEAEKS